MSADYLVTGATGLLGNNVVRQLLEDDVRVRVLVRSAPPVRALVDLDVDFCQGDVTDEPSVRQAVQGVRCVVPCAGDLHIGWRNVERQRRVNAIGTQHVAQAAQRVGARLIHVSTVDTLPASVDGEPITEESQGQDKVPTSYAVTKREAEEIVQQHEREGLDALIVHPGFMLGPWDWKPSSGRMLLSVAKTWKPMAPTGGMSGCDVREVARGVISAATRGVSGRRYILAGENISYLSAWKLFARVAGRPGPLMPAGPLVRIVAGFGGDLWGRLSGHEPELNSALVKMSRMLHYYDSSRATEELDYRVASFEDAVRAAWSWFQAYGYV